MLKLLVLMPVRKFDSIAILLLRLITQGTLRLRGTVPKLLKQQAQGRDFVKTFNRTLPFLAGLLTVLSAPVFATVTIKSMTPSHASPEPIGKTIVWTVTATDSNTGPLTFQFNITPPGGKLTMLKDFNVGTLSAGIWTANPFVWVPTETNGVFKIEVVAKDFASGQTVSRTASFQVTPAATGGNPVVEKTANPLVALFNAPSCPAGSNMRIAFQEQSGSLPLSSTLFFTNWANCHPPGTMTFEVAGMYPSATYNMYAQTLTGGTTTSGPTLTFTTGALPEAIPFPKFTVKTPGADTAYPIVIHNPIFFGTGEGHVYPDMATDLAGNVIWYYYSNDTTHSDVLTRPLPGGSFLSLQDDIAWDPTVPDGQFLRQVDLAGNIVRETNMGVIQQQLKAMGAVDWGPCVGVTNPAVGAACPGAFHHDAIQTLPNGYTAALVDLEKIFPAGTQGDTSGLPVDIVGDMILVLDANWQIVWYWDVFDPAHGGNGYADLPIARKAILGETCGTNTSGCPPMFLLGSNNIAPLAHDWLHANSLYYWPSPQDNAAAGDIVWSSRHQDSIMKIDYQDGAGTGDILWRMGPPDDLTPVSNFTFKNNFNDPWPWFSHQHDVGIENGGTGPMTLFDNGDTRIAKAPLGLGVRCKPNDCDSRGMAVTFSETTWAVTPVVSFDLGGYSTAMGSAQLLDDGNYFFENPIVVVETSTYGFSLEINPSNPAPQVGPADVLLNLVGPEHYRGWQVPNLYQPPTT
jgi:arylsulfate sulfotransferase